MQDATSSDSKPESDVNIKENIVPVAWPVEYASPAIVERQSISGLLDLSGSDQAK